MAKAVQRLIKIEADENGNPPSRIHLLSVGHWHTPWHGAFEHTSADLAEMVEHFNEGIGLVKGSDKFAINYSHYGGEKAAAWVTELGLDNDGTELWAEAVEWTPAGAQALKDKEFRYISPEWNPREFPWEDPEEEGTFVENVITGAGLTNIPLFKKLTPIMASRDVGQGDNKQPKGGDMTLKLEEVRVKKVEDLTDEEKSYLAEHKAELTEDEQKSFNLVDASNDTSAGNDADAAGAGDDKSGTGGDEDKATGANPATNEASAAPKGLTASQKKEWAQLQADAKAGRQAQQELLRNRLTASVKAHVDRGAIKSDQLDSTVNMLMASSEDTRKAQLAFMEGLPENKVLASEIGKGTPVEAAIDLTEEDKLMADAFNVSHEDFKKAKQEAAEKEGN